jgi:hypothetical protein
VQLIEDLSYERVAYTPVVGTSKHAPFVSTVWLGIDHRFFPDRPGAPIIFETMIFGIESLEDYRERYASEEDALAGHQRAVTLAKTALDMETPGGADEPAHEPQEHDERG